MIGYKGFDKNFCCREFQYEVGKTYHYEGEIKICQNGYHFCDNPLAVLEFYSPTNSRFALVESGGTVINSENDSHKFCTDRLTVLKELSLEDLIKSCKNINANTGDFSAATNTGDCSVASNTGEYSVATNTGEYSTAIVTGKQSVAIVTGCDGKAKGALNCWLVLSEFVDGSLNDVKAFKVDGVTVLPDVFYVLKDGNPCPVDDD